VLAYVQKSYSKALDTPRESNEIVIDVEVLRMPALLFGWRFRPVTESIGEGEGRLKKI
jgi:hypothetical protein